MRIKEYERIDGARPPSTRPKFASADATRFSAVRLVASMQEALGGDLLDSVMLSREVRAFASVLTHDLPAPLRLLARDVLTRADRALLTLALEVAEREGFGVAEVTKLVVDLTTHRMLEQGLSRPVFGAREAQGEPGLRVPAARATHVLSLPELGHADEEIARAILTTGGLRETSLDRGFVRALLEPSALPGRSVSLAFVQRLVAVSSPAVELEDGASAQIRPGLALAAREARTVLSRALTALALPAFELDAAADAAFTIGASLFRTRAHASFVDDPARMEQSFARPLLALSRADRVLLRAIYAAEHAGGRDLALADDVVVAVARFRGAERAANAEVLPPLRARQALAAARVARTRSAPIPTNHVPAQTQQSDPDVQAPLRSFGSVAQVAERLFGTVRRLAPASTPPTFPSSSMPAPLDQAGATASREGTSVMPPGLPRPLDLAQALGLSVLVAELDARVRRARRLRLTRRRRAPERLAHSAAEPDAEVAPVKEESARRRARWQTLLARRRTRPRRER